MARTRLRGLEIAGIQIGIEVPETCVWEWPEAPISAFQCLPRDPEVHVGVRVASLPEVDLGGERYAFGPFTFEVARQGGDWLLGLSQAGARTQLAHFDRDFRVGEIVVTPEVARSRAYPLRGPLDEWIVLHRSVARGGLVLTGSAYSDSGEAVVRLGREADASGGRWHTPGASLMGRNAVLLREERGELRLFQTPWSEPAEVHLPMVSRVQGIERTDVSELAFDDLLDPQEAAELLVAHAIVPLCDDGLFDRVLRNAQRIAAAVRVVERGLPQTVEGAPLAWRSRALQSAFAPPGSGC